jgi:hypothetical protein
MVPGKLFWEVKLTTVFVLPEPLVPKYAIPLPLNAICTWFDEICVNVTPEVAEGVHVLPTAFEVQPAAEPKPGLRVCRSNVIVPVGVVKVAQLLRLGVRVGAPTRLPWVTPVVPP